MEANFSSQIYHLNRRKSNITLQIVHIFPLHLRQGYLEYGSLAEEGTKTDMQIA